MLLCCHVVIRFTKERPSVHYWKVSREEYSSQYYFSSVFGRNSSFHYYIVSGEGHSSKYNTTVHISSVFDRGASLSPLFGSKVLRKQRSSVNCIIIWREEGVPLCFSGMFICAKMVMVLTAVYLSNLLIFVVHLHHTIYRGVSRYGSLCRWANKPNPSIHAFDCWY